MKFITILTSGLADVSFAFPDSVMASEVIVNGGKINVKVTVEMMASRKKEMIIDCNETPASYNN